MNLKVPPHLCFPLHPLPSPEAAATSGCAPVRGRPDLLSDSACGFDWISCLPPFSVSLSLSPALFQCLSVFSFSRLILLLPLLPKYWFF